MNRFFASFNSPDLLYMPRLSDVFGLYTKMVLATGLIFQMPTVVLFLAKMQMLTARFLIKQFKMAVLIIFIIAAVITPDGNPMGQAIMAAPNAGLVRTEHPDCLDRWSKTAHWCTERRRLKS